MTRKTLPDLATDTDALRSRNAGSSTAHESACLVVIQGARLGTRVALDNARTTIGRGSSCDFHIPERNVSREHCTITRRADSYWLQDLGSTNQTVLNESAVDKVSLSDGDQLRVGSTILKFIGPENIEADYHLELHENAVRDALTGLYNRRQLIGLLELEARQRRDRQNQPLTLALLDVDHFKSINDELGHLAGDSALRQLTAILAKNIQPGGVLARIGGEEFALLMCGTTESVAQIRLEQIRQAVADYSFELEGRQQRLTISIGIASWSSDMTGTSDLLRAADKRLYRAKSEGRNRVC